LQSDTIAIRVAIAKIDFIVITCPGGDRTTVGLYAKEAGKSIN
jgi:hypothetical protein